jgi:hypothetical protein
VKVLMKIQITGTRDGVAWPPPGETKTLPDDEGARLCARGYAEPVVEKRGEEKRPAAKRAEKRA